MKRKRLTHPQLRVLDYLAEHGPAVSSILGVAACGEYRHGTENSKHPVPRSPQGAGRIGGAIAARLHKRGLVCWSRAVDGFSSHQITPAGRAALASAANPRI